jgi:SAM-dependent methyltransferase/Flp pilus assembly protein TadD
MNREAVSNAFAIALQHHQAGRLGQAEALYRQILAEEPQHADALNCLGLVAHSAGRSEAAVDLIMRAIGADPAQPNYYNNLGLPLQRLGRLDEAVASYRKALSLRPAYAEALYNLGNALKEQGRLADAIAAYETALADKPDFAEAWCNLGNAQRSRGEVNIALANFIRALAIKELPEAKNGFAACLRSVRFSESNDEIRQLLTRAIAETWGAPGDLAPAAIGLIKANPEIAACLARVVRAWPARPTSEELFGTSGWAALANDALLAHLLESVQICDIELERLLTMVRLALLDAAETGEVEARAKNILDFHCALAQQCFLNEYCFDVAGDELERAASLRDRLDADAASGKTVSPLRLAAVAAYYPLHTVTSAPALLAAEWPEAVRQLVRQQIAEPAEEKKIAATIATLTPINAVTVDPVRRQYEQNPFPRWAESPRIARSVAIDTLMRQQFPRAPLVKRDDCETLDVLIAGCGTGRHAIETAQQFVHARVLAIDLSLASLAYAVRKTRESGVGNIEYAQADIVRLADFDKRFDLIEAVGVLHHLGDPLAGWRTLRNLLRPGGFMRLGLYSEAARTTVVAARKFIAERGYRPVPEDIRRCRQELVAAGTGSEFQALLEAADFFSTSECRDLLFNAREHRFKLPQIKEQLAELGLEFIGFSLAPETLNTYAARFPGDAAMTDLDHWHAFESDRPGTFAGMYQFWTQSTT